MFSKYRVVCGFVTCLQFMNMYV